MAISSQPITVDKLTLFKNENQHHHKLNWSKLKKPTFKRYLLLQVIRAITENPIECQSTESLATVINRNTAIKSQNREGIIKDQLKVYIESLIYYGCLDDSSTSLVLNDKIYDELDRVERIINRNSGVI